MNDLAAEITRLQAREQSLLEANNDELERRREAERQAVSFEVMAKAMLAEAGRPYRLQIRVAEWVRTRIGVEHMATPERAMRLIEEAVELAQAEGITAEQIIRQVKHVYGRKAGESTQEMGGVLVCAMAWCAAAHVDLVDVVEKEVERIEAQPIEEIRGSLARKADADLVVVVAVSGAVTETKTCECPARTMEAIMDLAADACAMGKWLDPEPIRDLAGEALLRKRPCPCAGLRATTATLRRRIQGRAHEETIRTALERGVECASGDRARERFTVAISALAALQEERRLEVVVVEAARRIRQWHDTESGGMVVSWKSVNALWDTLAALQEAQNG